MPRIRSTTMWRTAGNQFWDPRCDWRPSVLGQIVVSTTNFMCLMTEIDALSSARNSMCMHSRWLKIVLWFYKIKIGAFAFILYRLKYRPKHRANNEINQSTYPTRISKFWNFFFVQKRDKVMRRSWGSICANKKWVSLVDCRENSWWLRRFSPPISSATHVVTSRHTASITSRARRVVQLAPTHGRNSMDILRTEYLYFSQHSKAKKMMVK